MSGRPVLRAPIRAVCFDWGGTLMVDDGPEGVPMNLWPEVAAVPGAEACLKTLHGRVPLCVATNAAQSDRAMIEDALGRVGLVRYVDRVFCLREVGWPKDRSEFWLAVARELGVVPGQVAMIGDSLEHDVLAPGRHGIQSVWFNPRGVEPRKGAVVVSYASLPAFARHVARLVEASPGRFRPTM